MANINGNEIYFGIVGQIGGGGASACSSSFVTEVPTEKGFAQTADDNAVDLHDYDLQQLGFSDSTGTFSGADSKYADSVDYVPIPEGSYFVSCVAQFSDSSYGNWAAYLYDENKTYLYSETNSRGFLNWGSNTTQRALPASAKYIRFIIKNGPRTAFDLNDLVTAKAIIF